MNNQNSRLERWHVTCCSLLQNQNIKSRADTDILPGRKRILSETLETVPAIDNRTEADRRNFTWRTVFYGFMRSRRHGTRRAAEADPVFTDWHHPWLFFLATGIMVLSSMDAFFTVQLIERGAYEANPVMAAVMQFGTKTFAASKMALTGFGILALVFLSRSRFFNRVRAGVFLTGFFSVYAVLVCYEFVNLMAHM